MSHTQRTHEHYMRMALELAREAFEAGEVPVGCVIVRDGTILGSGFNRVQQLANPTHHAEIEALNQACSTVGEKVLKGATAYVTLEPCVMCAGALVLAKVETVVYAAHDPKTGAVRSVYELLDSPEANHQCIVRSGVLASESSALLTTFFEQRRADQATAAVSTGDGRITPAETGMLVLIPTPIGNLADITRRALDTLSSCKIILCEDTRRTGNLLRSYGIGGARLVSNFEQNEKARAQEIVDWVRNGITVGLVSDAGMPGISDPGFRAVQACISAGCSVVALPGPSAAITALAASGLPTDRFFFAGFLPQKKGRMSVLQKMLCREETCILYESPHRIEKLLIEIAECGSADRQIVIARVLSKVHEEYIRGMVSEVLATVRSRNSLKGECVVVLQGAGTPD